MDVLNSVIVNGATFPIHNDTDYFVDGALYSDYGFELFYGNRRGMRQMRWVNTLDALGFGAEPPNRTRAYGDNYYSAETFRRSLDFTRFMDRPFVLHWVSGGVWYGLGFDGYEFVMQTNDANYWLPSVIL